jgi:hypothetical protein
MTEPTALHQLGLYVVKFQAIEELLNNVIALIANSDEESVAILISGLEFNKRTKVADVLFARFLGLRVGKDDGERATFHSVMTKLEKLAERRNDLVHSTYNNLYHVDGSLGLLRKNSKLRSSAGRREETVEQLKAESFNADFAQLAAAEDALEALRMKIINWRHPIENT